DRPCARVRAETGQSIPGEEDPAILSADWQSRRPAPSRGAPSDTGAGGVLRAAPAAGVCPALGAPGPGLTPMRAKPLSATELAQIPEFVERWTQIGLSTTPIDREAADPILHR